MTVKHVAFVLRPEQRGDRFTEQAAAGAVGQRPTVNRLDGSSVQAEVVDARLMPDGCITLTVAVPGGIDRAPQEQT